MTPNELPQVETLVIGETCHVGDAWFRKMRANGVDFLVPLDDQEAGQNTLGAALSWLQQRSTLTAQGGEADSDEAQKTFATWFCLNYPGPHTIISDPNWHAPRIFRQAQWAIKSTTPPAPSSSAVKIGVLDELSKVLEWINSLDVPARVTKAQSIRLADAIQALASTAASGGDDKAETFRKGWEAGRADALRAGSGERECDCLASRVLHEKTCATLTRPEFAAAAPAMPEGIEVGSGMQILPPTPWTDDQCAEFLSVAFRHVRIVGEFTYNDIRLGQWRAAMLAPAGAGDGK
jgi:hypothetical protein